MLTALADCMLTALTDLAAAHMCLVQFNARREQDITVQENLKHDVFRVQGQLEDEQARREQLELDKEQIQVHGSVSCTLPTSVGVCCAYLASSIAVVECCCSQAKLTWMEDTNSLQERAYALIKRCMRAYLLRLRMRKLIRGGKAGDFKKARNQREGKVVACVCRTVSKCDTQSCSDCVESARAVLCDAQIALDCVALSRIARLCCNILCGCRCWKCSL